MSRGSAGASKTGLEHEIELLEEMRKQLNVTISMLPSATKIDPAELIHLRSQGTKLLGAVEKAILRRELALRLEELERRRPVLRSFNQKYEALLDLRNSLHSNAGASGRSSSPEVPRPVTNVSSEDFLNELRRVREQIFRALSELNESEEGR